MAEGKKILIIDDDKSLQEVLKIKLESVGFETDDALNGKSGLKKALDTHPDLILLDLVMPEMTGQEMLTELQKDSWGKTAPVIILTNVSDPIKMAQTEEGSVGNTTLFDYVIKSDSSLDKVVEKVKEKLGE